MDLLELNSNALLSKFTGPLPIKKSRGENGKYKRIQIKNKINKKHPISGIYIFWWSGDLSILKNGDLTINVKGNRIKKDFADYYESIKGIDVITKKGVDYIKYTHTWKIENRLTTKFGYPLYVGKSTNINRRIGEHILPETIDYGSIVDEFGLIDKKTTACQLRSHLEFILKVFKGPQERLDLIMNNVKVSYIITDIERFEERFYIEDYLIGQLQSMFNIDSER